MTNMSERILEREPGDPKKKQELSPLPKMALELGPLLVFFFANSRGEWLVERFPALGDLGGPLFVATALFMVAVAISLVVSWMLTLRWGIFFLFLAVLNEVVWRNFSTDFWVAFKVWGTMPITIAFTLSQMPLIMRHAVEEKPANN
jgi:intracellular septation protein